MSLFPAILVGGPPHSGKSVLVYSLSQALRNRRISHYVLRACPDGEGDWANEAQQALVRTIRLKGEFTAEFSNQIVKYLSKRHLPLLVDVGGKPTAAQEAVFSHCTHAILLVADQAAESAAYVRNLAAWQSMMIRQGVSVIAQLKSVLHAESQLIASEPIVTGIIGNLERGQIAGGATFDVLVQKISALFAFSEAELTGIHLKQAPVELTLDLPALARTLGAQDGYWRPQQLPKLAEYLPTGKPLGAYGRAPNWVYALLALLAYPAPVFLFDARLGWIEPPILTVGGGKPQQVGWEMMVQDQSTYTWIEMRTYSQYLDIAEADRLPLIAPAMNKGLVLSGKIPHWLLMSVVRRFAPYAPWTAVYQPSLPGAVVVHSQAEQKCVGQLFALQPPAAA